MMELKDTIELMNSDDYKDRFKAEYWQVKIRYEKLHRMTVQYEAGTLSYMPDTPLEYFLTQKKAMGEYLNALEIRAELEDIKLFD